MGGTTGPPLNLTWPPPGSENWDAQIDADFNAINSAIGALQAAGATGPAGDRGATGAVGMIFAGPWSSAVAYVPTDVVTFNGSSYIATVANSNAEPDTHPTSWSAIALAGATGATGLQGPQGVPGTGGGTTVTFPIAVEQGGTGADNPDEARQNLNAAANGQNRDINALFNLECGTTPDPTTTAITIRSNGGEGTAISVGDGTNFGGITSSGGIFCRYINSAGQVICGGLLSSGLLQCNNLGDGTPGNGIDVSDQLRANATFVVAGTAPAVAAGRVGLGGTIASTASPGGGQTMPSSVLGYWVGNFGGVAGKIPILAP